MNNQNALALIPLAERQQSLSKNQRTALEKALISYARKKMILLKNLAVTENLAEVVWDALLRGLALYGKDSLSKEDKVPDLLKSGFAERDRIRLSACRILETDANASLAYDATLLESAANELKGFAGLAQLDGCEALVSQHENRSQLLEELFSWILQETPLAGQAFDLLAKLKMFRNMLVSWEVRGNLNPFMAIEEWEAICQSKKEISSLGSLEFLEELKGLFPEKFQNDDTSDFLRDLASQSRKFLSEISLPSNGHVTEVGTARNRNILFRRLSEFFFLTPASLKKFRMIVNTDQIPERKSRTSHLWDDEHSELVGGARVPTAEALERALWEEIDPAKKGRLSHGRRLWDLYRGSLNVAQRKAAGVGRLQSEVSSKEKEIRYFEEHSEVEAPEAAYGLVILRGRNEWKKSKQAQSALDADEKAILAWRKERDRALEWQKQINDRPKGPLPNGGAVPREIFLQEIAKELRFLRVSLVWVKRRLEKNESDEKLQAKRESLATEISRTARLLKQYQNPAVPLPREAVWNRRKFKAYIREVLIITQPLEDGVVSEESKSQAESIYMLFRGFYSGVSEILPRAKSVDTPVTSRAQLAGWALQKSEQAKHDTGVRHFWQRWESAFKTNKFVPLPEGKGLPAKRFFEIFKERARLVHVLAQNTHLQLQLVLAKEKLKQAARREYLSLLKEQVRELNGKIEDASSSIERVTAEFLSKMGALNLVVRKG